MNDLMVICLWYAWVNIRSVSPEHLVWYKLYVDFSAVFIFSILLVHCVVYHATVMLKLHFAGSKVSGIRYSYWNVAIIIR